MHNEDYIASGILELYAAGALTRQEQEEVEQRAAASPEVRAALDEACAAIEAYARLHAVEPQKDLKARILGEIGAGEPDNVYPLYPESGKEPSPYKWMFAASISLFLISGIMSFYFYQKWQQAEQQLASAQAGEQLLAQNTSLINQQLQDQDRLLSILRNPAYQAVNLKGLEAHPDARAMVYWNPEQQEVYLEVLQLPAPPAGKQYQLRALENGKPIDAGVLQLSSKSLALQQMKQIRAAQAFAITLEPAGGSGSPTLEQLYVMGEVKT